MLKQKRLQIEKLQIFVHELHASTYYRTDIEYIGNETLNMALQFVQHNSQQIVTIEIK